MLIKFFLMLIKFFNPYPHSNGFSVNCVCIHIVEIVFRELAP